VSLRRSKPGKADQDPSHQASDEQSHAIPLPGDEPHFCYHVISRWWHHLSRKSVKRSLSAQPCSEIPGGSEYRDTDETLAVSAKAAPKENGRAAALGAPRLRQERGTWENPSATIAAIDRSFGRHPSLAASPTAPGAKVAN